MRDCLALKHDAKAGGMDAKQRIGIDSEQDCEKRESFCSVDECIETAPEEFPTEHDEQCLCPAKGLWLLFGAAHESFLGARAKSGGGSPSSGGNPICSSTFLRAVNLAGRCLADRIGGRMVGSSQAF